MRPDKIEKYGEYFKVYKNGDLKIFKDFYDAKQYLLYDSYSLYVRKDKYEELRNLRKSKLDRLNEIMLLNE